MDIFLLLLDAALGCSPCRSAAWLLPTAHHEVER
jgi:hypothetical protein